LTKHLIRDIISGSCFLWPSTIFFAMNFWILTFKFLLDYAEYNLLKLQPQENTNEVCGANSVIRYDLK
jgi:hypothetical protein